MKYISKPAEHKEDLLPEIKMIKPFSLSRLAQITGIDKGILSSILNRGAIVSQEQYIKIKNGLQQMLGRIS